MPRNVRVVTALVSGAAALLVSCADADRLPTVGGLRSQHGARVVGMHLVTPAERKEPLAAAVTWSFTVGAEGGESRNDAVGLTIVVPAGAVSEAQTITVTALAGSAVAYRFEPHIDFAQDVLLVQDRSAIRGLSLVYGGAHFEGDAPQHSNGKVIANELASAVTSLVNGKVSIAVRHFSGWIVVSGNENSSTDSSSAQQ
jgi:hypothetical protein